MAAGYPHFYPQEDILSAPCFAFILLMGSILLNMDAVAEISGSSLEQLFSNLTLRAEQIETPYPKVSDFL
jgi:hypothetical protein